MNVSGLLLPICSIFFSGLLCYEYFSKKRINLLENKMYGIMIVCTLFDGIIVSILQGLVLGEITDTVLFLLEVLNKIDFFLLIGLATCLFLYTSIITVPAVNAKPKRFIQTFIAIDIVGAILIVLSSINLISSNNNFTVSGSATIITYILCGIYLALSVLISVFNYKRLDRRHIPIFSIVIIMGFLILMFRLNPYLIVVSITLCFVNYIMYYTIENPDIKMIEQLNIARDQAEQANNAKTDFLSNMSHEIRTPLNAIVGFSHSLEKEELSNSAKEDVKYILSASDNLLDIVNSILDISKIEANKLEIVNTQYDINEVLDDLCALTRARLGEKPIEFKTGFDPSLPKVLYGDYVRLKQICINLLTNSVKYTREGFIEFKVDYVKKGDTVRLIISVEDSGIGIKRENIDKLFSKFERLDLEKNISIEGTGLGLAITKKLVELMGGSIVVQSEYGIGSKFTVAIDQKVVKPEEVQIHKSETEEIHTFEGKKILVVDDNKLNLKVAEKLLGEYKVTIQLVSSGDESIEKIKDGEIYDLILMDDMMPHKSGTETLKELKEIPDFNMKVVALTANAITGMKEKYLSEGFDDYLAKPIDKNELTRVLNKFLK